MTPCLNLYFARQRCGVTDRNALTASAIIGNVFVAVRYSERRLPCVLDFRYTSVHNGCPGIVGKKADSRYVGGRTKEWLKIKTRAGTEVMKKRVETWGR